MPLILQIDADNKKAIAAIKAAAKKAGASVKELEKKSVSSAKKMRQAFSRLAGIAGIAGVSVALRAATKLLFGFETALAEVSTLVDTSVVDMKQFNREILKLTTGIPQTAVQLTKGLYQVISAGVTDASDALFVLEVSAKAATGGLTDTNTAVTALTTILNSYQKNIREATDVSDVLFTTVRLGTLRFADISNAIGIVSTSAALAGVTFRELSAALGTMTKFGIRTEISVTALNRLFLQIVNPTTQLKEKSRELGVEFSAAALRAKGFAGFMAELSDAFDEDQDSLFTLGLDLRAFRALAVLSGKGANEFKRQLLEFNDVLGASDLAMKKILETTESQAQLLRNRLNVDFQVLGDAILPTVVFGFDTLLKILFPVGSMLDTYDEAVKNSTTSTDELTESLKRHQEVLDIISGKQRPVPEILGTGDLESREEIIKRIAGENIVITRELAAAERIRVEFVELRINKELEITLKMAEQVLLGDKIVEQEQKKLEFAFDRAAKEGLALIATIKLEEAERDVADQAEKVRLQTEAANQAAGRFAQNLARALISGKGLEKSLLNAALNFGLSLIPGGSLFGRFFAHGGIAPGGGIPSIVGEAGGAPEIIQSATPITVTPLTTNNNTSNRVSIETVVINNSGRELNAEDVSRAFNDAVDRGFPIRGR